MAEEACGEKASSICDNGLSAYLVFHLTAKTSVVAALLDTIISCVT
jgi:hypothetical protein